MIQLMAQALLGLAALLLAIEGLRKFLGRPSSSQLRPLPLPPGPKPLPFIGNLLDLNMSAPFLTYTAWSKKYGDIVYMRAMRQEFIILNTEEIANVLLEKRSQKYSDRPVFSAGDLFGWEWPTSTARYGPRFRLHRRLLHQFFNAQAALTYRPKQLQKAYELMTYLLDDPLDYTAHFTKFSAAVVVEVTYGYDTKGSETFVTAMQRAGDILLHVATVEVFALCDAFPFVKALPAWIPGLGFKAHAAECRSLTVESVNAPYEWVQRRIAKGLAAPSMVADAITKYHLEDDSKDPELAQAIKDSAGSLYAAAVETTNAILVIFAYLMMNHPEIQRRAQAEIDSVVGYQRLPDFEDRASLPYMDAIMRETMRWHPVLPMGLPHATSEDDVYQGYFIPQGVSIIPNIWGMSRNEEKYPNPEAFIPERFLDKDGSLSEDNLPWIFGFGRRICPGRHVAEVSLWSAMACILTLFTIEKTVGSEKVKWTTGLSSHPLPFPCKFMPRDKGMDAQKLASLIYASRIDL